MIQSRYDFKNSSQRNLYTSLECFFRDSSQSGASTSRHFEDVKIQIFWSFDTPTLDVDHQMTFPYRFSFSLDSTFVFEWVPSLNVDEKLFLVREYYWYE